MRARNSIAGLIAGVGLAALTLAGCGSPSTASWHWAGGDLTGQPVPAGTTATIPPASTTIVPPAVSTQDDSTAPPAPTATTTQQGPATTTATQTTATSTTEPDGPLDPDTPHADVIVGSTEHRTGGSHIALTFDDGPDPTWTPQVLAVLAQYHVRATFCLIGVHVQAHPDLVRDIANAGDALCDHTMTHDENLPSRTHQVKYDEIDEDKQAILTADPGAQVHYYRAPGGAFSHAGDPDSVQRIAAGLGMQPLAWSIDTVDWTKPGVRHIVSAIESAGTHDVVLLHDAGGDRSETLAALRIALPWLIDHGYQFDIPA